MKAFITLALMAATLVAAQIAPAATQNLSPAKDNTLYEVMVGAPESSNGSGQFMFVGNTGRGDIRRAVLAFDLSSIPAGSSITSATLFLHMSRTIVGATTVSAHRVLADWGEGASDAGANEGQGAAAAAGDATWFNTFFPGTPWATPGGDFVAAPSASQSVAGIQVYSWSGPGLAADVQNWLDNPASNFGWAMLGDEATVPSAKRFDTRENGVPANQPVLVVDYQAAAALDVTMVPLNPPIVIPAAGGSFGYNVQIVNTTAADVTADVILQAVLPGGSVFPVLSLPGVVFPAGSTIVRPGLSQDVPAAAPAGTYAFRLGAVQAGGSLIDGDQFGFQKLAVGPLANPVLGWGVANWDGLIVDQAGDGLAFDKSQERAITGPALLHDVSPNPFNPQTTIAFELQQPGRVTLRVFNLSGRLVRTLLSAEHHGEGLHQAVWNGRNNAGQQSASGTYFLRLEVDGFVESRRMTLVK